MVIKFESSSIVGSKNNVVLKIVHESKMKMRETKGSKIYYGYKI